MIGGYESPDVEFSMDNGIPGVSGEGSVLVISFTYLDAGTTPPQLSDATAVNVLLMDRVGDYSSSRMAEDTVIDVAEIKLAADGTASMSGTFSGTLPERDNDSAATEITNGRFQLEAARQATPG